MSLFLAVILISLLAYGILCLEERINEGDR